MKGLKDSNRVPGKVSTYRRLLKVLASMSDEQLDADITIEVGIDDECYPAELRFAGETHSSLEENHPVIFVR